MDVGGVAQLNIFAIFFKFTLYVETMASHEVVTKCKLPTRRVKIYNNRHLCTLIFVLLKVYYSSVIS